MRVEVVVPELSTGDVIGDLVARRGQIAGLEMHSVGMQAVKGTVPLAEMFGYATACARSPRAAARSRWSSTTTSWCLPNGPRQILGWLVVSESGRASRGTWVRSCSVGRDLPKSAIFDTIA